MTRALKLTSSRKLTLTFRLIVLYITILHSSISTNLYAQPSSVTFSVDLTYSQLSAEQSVVLRGSSATLGRWQGSDLRLTPAGDNVYSITVTFPERDLNQELFYKYAIVGPQKHEQWESRPNRSLYLAQGQQLIDPVFFDDLDRPVLSQDLPVRILLDLNAFGYEPPTRVGISGNQMPLGSLAPDMLTIMSQKAGIWTADLLFEAGTPTDLSFRFFLEIDGKWQQEPQRHSVLLNNNRPSRTISMTHDGTRILPASRSEELLTDDFAGIAQALKEGGNRYLLDAALHQLDSGLFDDALSTYEAFKTEYLDTATEAERTLLQDQFPLRYGQTLYASGYTQRAMSFFARMEQEPVAPERKAGFAYTLAAAQLAAGDYDDAILAFEDLQNDYGTLDGFDYSALLEQGIAHLEAGQYGAGVPILNALDTGEHQYASAMKILGHVHSDSTNFDAAIDAFEAIKGLGTDEEQIKTHLLILETKINAGYYSEALQQIESLLKVPSPTNTLEDHLRRSAKSPYRTAHLLFLKARIFEIQQRFSAADAIYQQLISQFANAKHAQLARTRITK